MTVPPSPSDTPTTNPLRVGYVASRGEVARVVSVGDRSVTHVRALRLNRKPRDAFAAWWGGFIRGNKPTPDRYLQPLRYIDLFSSVGGLSVGANEAIDALGLRGLPLLAADSDERALQVYKANFRVRQTVTESIRGMVDFRVSGSGERARFAYEPTVIDERLSALSGSTDLILAGPPCQGHSSLNNHSRHEDPKNLLYLTVPAAAVALGARHIVIENVPNVVADKHGVVQTTMALLRSGGYNLTSAGLAADRFGWPQTRKRFFLVASRDTRPLPLREFSKSQRREAMPVSWLLNDLAKKRLDDGDVMRSVPHLSPDNQLRMNWLFDHEEHNLPNAIRPDCHKEGTTYAATYGRMFADQPAPTITGGFLTPGRGRFLHPTQRRVLTPREAARIQGFPDWFNFVVNHNEPPSRIDISRWIGNAVPSILGFIATLAALAGEAKVSEAYEAQTDMA
jgi:DNA (cytosine-5)-methyltransferase 1